jgi:hypothetical protein
MTCSSFILAATVLLGPGISAAQQTAAPESLDDSPVETPGSPSDQVQPIFWSDFDPADSSLLSHAIAVHAALQAREAAEQQERADAADRDCKLLYRPDSLIMAKRCIAEVPGFDENYELHEKFMQRYYEELREIARMRELQ